MAALAKRRYTLEEYLELEKHAEERYVYCDGAVVAMSGASLRHNRIVRNLMRAIDARLEGNPCEVLPTDMRIKVPKALPYRYADLVVVCGEPVIEDMQGLEVLVNPLIILEVLSASTEAYDRGIKFFEYQSIASFQEYVLVAQDCPHITHYVRQEGGQWLRSDFHGVAEHLLLRVLDCAIPVVEIYRQVPPLSQDET
jgi:Uma2 family endonuclease